MVGNLFRVTSQPFQNTAPIGFRNKNTVTERRLLPLMVTRRGTQIRRSGHSAFICCSSQMAGYPRKCRSDWGSTSSNASKPCIRAARTKAATADDLMRKSQPGGDMTNSLQDQWFLSSESFGNVLVVKPTADPRSISDGSKQQAYNSVMRKIGRNEGQGLLIDLSHCEMLDSLTVGIFIQLSREVVRLGGETAMCGASSAIRDTLARLMLLEPNHRIFAWRQFTTVTCAMAELQPPSDE